jgi:hypothetical protein
MAEYGMKTLVDFLSGHIGRIAAGLVIPILVAAYFRRASIDNGALSGPRLYVVNSVLAVLIVVWAFVIVSIVIHGFFGEAPVAEQPEVHSPYCLVYAFPEPSSPDKAPDLLKDLKLPDEPAGCLRDIASHISEATQVTLLGRTDRRELSPEAAREYRSNDALALQRAKDMEVLLAPKDGADLLTAGPRYLAGKTDARLMERDRSVEIRAHWNNSSANAVESRPKAGGLLNAASIGPDVSMALLALMVALSAYLVTVGIFLADRVEKLEARNQTALKAKKIKLQRRLLVLADTPTVVAAFLLSLHVFAFYPSVTLVPASILLFRMSIVTLILFHMSQWITALPDKVRAFLGLK